MPELPEVEAVARALRPLVRGQRIQRCQVLHKIAVRPQSAATLRRRLEGRRVQQVERRGKYLVLRLDDGCCCAALQAGWATRLVRWQPGERSHRCRAAFPARHTGLCGPAALRARAVVPGAGGGGGDSEAGPGSACARFHARLFTRSYWEESPADEAAADGPDARRRARQHLCKRVALAGAHQPAAVVASRAAGGGATAPQSHC